MTDLMELDGPRQGPASGGTAKQLVILLHGLGADGNDLIGLAPHWADILPYAAFVSPNAPYPCDMAPMGYQWFSVQDRSPEAMLAGVRMAAPALDAFIDRELAQSGLPASQVALVGFSQGTMMSLYVAPRRAAELAGVTFPTATSALTRLLDLGIVEEVTGKARGRVFAYRRYLDLLSEGTEPI